MRNHHSSYVFLLLLFCCRGFCYVSAWDKEPETPDWRTTLKTIRNGIHRIDTYLNAALDLFGGDDGLCRYRCSDGKPDFTFFSDNLSLNELNIHVDMSHLNVHTLNTYTYNQLIGLIQIRTHHMHNRRLF